MIPWATALHSGLGVGSWTLACSDGTVLSGSAPFVSEVDAQLGADCKFSLSLNFRVASDLDLSDMMFVPRVSASPQRAPKSPLPIGINSMLHRTDGNQELIQWPAGGAVQVINRSSFDPFIMDDKTTFPGRSTRTSVRQLVGQAENECDDTEGVFASIAFCVTNSECSPFLDAFGVLFGGAASACQASVASIRTAASDAGCPLSFSPPGASDDALLYELCPASCARRNFAVSGCSIPTSPPALPAPPSPPPLPSLYPARSGFTTVVTEGQLRSAIQAAPPLSNVSLYLPPSSVFLLGGDPIIVGPINLHLASDGEGSTLDAESLSRVIQVQRGGRVQMWSLTLANGESHAIGGTMHVTDGVRIDMISCRVVKSATQGYGGAIAITGGRMMLLGSSIVNSSAQQGGGAIFITRGSVTVANGSLVAASSAQGSGGTIYLEGGSVVVDGGSSLVDSTAKRSGGLVRVERGSMIVTGGSAIIRSTSLGADGGAMDIASGFVMLTGGSSIIESSANYGGAIAIGGGGGLTVTGGSSIVNSSAETNGGALLVRGGSVTITNSSSIVGSKSWLYGGAMHLRGGTVTLSGGSSIASSTCELGGGAVAVIGGSLTVSGGSSIVNSFCNGNGGAILINLGVFTLEGGSFIINSTSRSAGGAMYITGGTIFVSESLISRSLGGISGGCMQIEGGELRLTGTTIDQSRSISGWTQILLASSFTGFVPLVLITRSEFRQKDCGGQENGGFLFHQVGVVQIVLRNITFTPLAGCNKTMLESPAAFLGIAAKDCDESYQTFNPSSGLVELTPVCSSTALGACTSHPVPGTTLKSLFCACPLPEYVNPTSPDAVISPYLPHSGCITPRRLEALRVISDHISVTLKKPSTEAHILALTMSGDDTQYPASWAVSNAHQVRSQSPWLQLPSISGETATAGQLFASVDIAVQLSTSGLREQVGGYTQTLMITVRSALLDRTLSCLVSLIVTATVHTTTWGQVNGSTCASAGAPRLDVGTTVGEEHLVPFTACDADNLPVAHRLPSKEDSREFMAAIVAPYPTTSSESPVVIYSGEGLYAVLLSLAFHGPFVLHLHLGDQHVLTRNGTSRCSVDKMAANSGVCVCPADKELVQDNECQKCAEDYYKSSAGNEPCQRRPLQWWPFAIVAAGGVSAVILLFALIQWSDRRRRERDMQLEQDFMAVT